MFVDRFEVILLNGQRFDGKTFSLCFDALNVGLMMFMNELIESMGPGDTTMWETLFFSKADQNLLLHLCRFVFDQLGFSFDRFLLLDGEICPSTNVLKSCFE